MLLTDMLFCLTSAKIHLSKEKVGESCQHTHSPSDRAAASGGSYARKEQAWGLPHPLDEVYFLDKYYGRSNHQRSGGEWTMYGEKLKKNETF